MAEDFVVDGGYGSQKEMVAGLRAEAGQPEGGGEAGPVTRSKRKRSEAMPTLVGTHEMSKKIAAYLIPRHHQHLASANIVFMAQNKPIKGIGGKVMRTNPMTRFLTPMRSQDSSDYGQPLDHVYYGDTNRDEADFLVLIGSDDFNNADARKRDAMIDHLLCRMTGTENPETGKMVWKLRDPDVQEFSEVAERHGSWNDKLGEMRDCLMSSDGIVTNTLMTNTLMTTMVQERRGFGAKIPDLIGDAESDLTPPTLDDDDETQPLDFSAAIGYGEDDTDEDLDAVNDDEEDAEYAAAAYGDGEDD